MWCLYVCIDGRPVRACVVPTGTLADHAITTTEAIGETSSGRKIQQAWLETEVIQGGHCQSGQTTPAAALVESNPNPSDADIDAVMSNITGRRGAYQTIRAAIKQAARAA